MRVQNEIYAAGPYLVFRAGEFHKEKMAFCTKVKTGWPQYMISPSRPKQSYGGSAGSSGQGSGETWTGPFLKLSRPARYVRLRAAPTRAPHCQRLANVRIGKFFSRCAKDQSGAFLEAVVKSRGIFT